MMRRIWLVLAVTVLAGLLVVGCAGRQAPSPVAPGETRSFETPSPVPATPTTLPASPVGATTAPPSPQTGMATPRPTVTHPTPLLPATPPEQPTQASASTTPATVRVQIFLIAIGDEGRSGKPVGCGDSVVPVSVELPYTRAVLRAALETLLSLKTQYYGQSGLYNALYQSDLRLADLSLEYGTARVYLEGTLRLGGECDIPRVKAQLEETALQFPTVTGVRVFLNGEPLEEVLSLR